LVRHLSQYISNAFAATASGAGFSSRTGRFAGVCGRAAAPTDLSDAGDHDGAGCEAGELWELGLEPGLDFAID